jgi:hypothetical protein
MILISSIWETRWDVVRLEKGTAPCEWDWRETT